MGCKKILKKDDVIIGVKIYTLQEDYRKLFNQWNDIGINTAYVSVDLSYDVAFRKLAKENNIEVYVILPIFFNAEALLEHQEWYGITNTGNITKEDWVEFISPSNLEYKLERIAFIKKVIGETKPDGLSIDFIRYFAYWEKIYSDRTLESIPNSSFDSLSIATFQREKELAIPDELKSVRNKSDWILKNHQASWTEWKCENINAIVGDIVSAAKEISAGLSINLHVVPWRVNDFDGAIKKIVGQDMQLLSKHVDYISPMCYSHMLKRKASWVSSVVKDMDSQVYKTFIVPSIQVKEAYLDDPLSEDEFEENMMEALKEPSKGVIFWSWEHLEKDPKKKLIIKSIVR